MSGSEECVLWLCCSQERAGMSGSGGVQSLGPCQLELNVEDKDLKMELDMRSLTPSPSSLELCAPRSPPHLVPEVPLDLYRSERCDSNGGDVEERGMPDTLMSPQSCSPLPFPKIPTSPPLTPPNTLLPPGDGYDSSSRDHDEVLSLSSSSPLSSIPSPTGSVVSLFGVSQDSSSQHQPRSVFASSSSSSICSNNQGSNGSSSAHSSPSSSSSSSSSSSTSSTAASTAPASPAEEADILCQWEACRSVVNPADLLEHLRIEHVDTQKDREKFVCQWAGCKVAGKASCSMSWLERHVVTHGGDKPFPCILPNCGARFPSQLALQRHVNGHFPAEAPSGTGRSHRSRGGEDTSGRHIRRKNKLKRRRPQCVKHSDFFDAGIMERLQQQLLDLTEKTQVHLNGSTRHVTFQGAVKARSWDENNQEKVLLQWSPLDLLEETWLAPSQVKSSRQRTIPLSHVPASSVASLHPSLYSSHRFRKHRRK